MIGRPSARLQALGHAGTLAREATARDRVRARVSSRAPMTHCAATRRLLGAVGLALLAFPVVACSHLVARSNAGIASLEAEPGPVGTLSRGAKYTGWAVSAPLVAVTTPVAALAWATPWVDLVTAVDIASAP